ncbi:MAG: FtsX-like permease family protein [Planctomycetes bacterium]|nr:FtsX-like permease family protein [Planctomycetota bacterium]
MVVEPERAKDVGLSRLLLLANLRHLKRHPWIVALAVIGIALGVGMSTGIDLAIASSRRAFAESVAGVAGRATHQIVAGPSGIPDAEYLRIRRELSPLATAPVVACDVSLPSRPGRILQLTGVDPLSEQPFRPYVGGVGSSGGSGGAGSAVMRLMGTPDGVALLRATADELGLELGSELAIRIGTRTRPLRVVALLDAGEAMARRALADVAVVDISTAQEILERVGRIDRIDVIAPEDDRRLAALALPAGAELVPAGARTAALEQMTRAFHLNLTALSLLALVVGMFLIYNTMSFLVVQRRELIGHLRLAGATRGQVAGAIIGEAAVLGAIGTAIGVIAGIGAAQVLVAGITRTVSDLYFVVAVRDVAVPIGHLALNAALGMGATLIAAGIPVWEATRTRPAAAVGRSTIESKTLRLAPWLAASGVAAIALAGVAIACSGRSIIVGFAALAVLILGYAALMPMLVALGAWTIRPLLGWLGGPIAAMAARSVVATLSRTGVAVAALVIASAASLGVGTMVGSFRASLIEWLDATLRSDVYVSPPRAVPARFGEVPLPDGLVERLAAAPGVRAMVTKRDAHPSTPEGRIDLVAFDVSDEFHGSFRFLSGTPKSAWPAFRGGEAVLVTEPYAFHHQARVGGSVWMRTDRGDHDFAIVGVIKDYSNDRGTVFISRAAYDRWWDDRGFSAASFLAAEGTTPEQLMSSLRAAAGSDELAMSSNASLRRDSLIVFDRTFAITGVIRILAGAVAFLGILGALLSLALERAREIGLMRMHGCTPGQVAALIGGQAAITGLFAGVLSIPLGIALSEVLALVINRRSFGWTFAISVDPWLCLQAVALALAASLLAAIHPARRLASTPPAAVLRRE